MLAYFFFKCKIREAPGYVQWFPGLFCCFKKIFNSHDSSRCLHPGRSTWNLRITHFKNEHHLPAIMFHRFQPFIFQGVFASFLDDDVHPYQKDFAGIRCGWRKKHPKKSHPPPPPPPPQSARNLTPPSQRTSIHPWLARWSMFQVSQWWLLQLHSSPSNCPTRWDVTGQSDGFKVFPQQKIGVKSLNHGFFHQKNCWENSLVVFFLIWKGWKGCCWVKDQAIVCWECYLSSLIV